MTSKKRVENGGEEQKNRDIVEGTGQQQQIITIAALCFALVSWVATAHGLKEYVFSNSVQAALISFGIQSILFVFNLRLPFFIRSIGELKPKEQHDKKQDRHKPTGAQIVTTVLYMAVLTASSFFSFVYICNEVVYNHNTGYADDDTILMSFYRQQLDETEKVIDENLKLLPIIASDKLADLQLEMDKAGLISHQDEDVNEEELKRKEQNAEADLNIKKTDLEIAKEMYEQAKKEFDSAKETRYWKVKEYEEAKEEYDKWQKDYNNKLTECTEAENEYRRIAYELDNYKPSSQEVVMQMLMEFLQHNIDSEEINGYMDELVKYVTDMGTEGEVPSNYAEMVQKVLELNSIVDNYTKLSGTEDSQELGAKESINQLKNNIEQNRIIPNPKNKEEFEKDKEEWTNKWREQFDELRKVVWSIPVYADGVVTSNNIDAIVDTECLEEYKPDEISKDIDKLMRNKLTDINVMERAWLALIGKYPLTAVIALIIAFGLDLISLAAGIIVYWMSEVENKKYRKEEKGERELVQTI